LRRYPEFPVESKGTNGVEWQFDVESVVEFMREKDEAERKELEKRAEAMKAWMLPIAEPATAAPGAISAAQQLQLARAAREQHKLAQESGLLIPASTVRLAARAAFSKLGPGLAQIADQVGRQHRLPDEIVQSTRAQIEDLIRLAVSEAARVLNEKSAELAAELDAA
jgi:phage terminase Nu1 subunit (DNA packaging protein)